MASNQTFVYREWQYPRISSFVPLVLFIPAIWIVAAPFNTNIGLFVGLGFAILGGVLKLTAAKHISITSELITLGDATIPLKAIGAASKISSSDQFAARGSQLDSRAFVFIKYGLPEMVKIEIKDTNDPTPYVLISTRRADDLIEALKK
ncbi:MAG: DUF3093 domain-containing protein [Micrococcales bacterium]